LKLIYLSNVVSTAEVRLIGIEGKRWKGDQEQLIHNTVEINDCVLFEGTVLVCVWRNCWMTTYEGNWPKLEKKTW
jgi:hypothetical protein